MVGALPARQRREEGSSPADSPAAGGPAAADLWARVSG